MILFLSKTIGAILDYVCATTTSALVCDRFLYHDDYLIITYFLTLPSSFVIWMKNKRRFASDWLAKLDWHSCTLLYPRQIWILALGLGLCCCLPFLSVKQNSPLTGFIIGRGETVEKCSHMWYGIGIRGTFSVINRHSLEIFCRIRRFDEISPQTEIRPNNGCARKRCQEKSHQVRF